MEGSVAANTGEATKVPNQNLGLVAENLQKSYRRRRVVNHVNFRVNRGEVVGLLGPNGAGKTTCFYMVMGLVPADGGSITIDGYDVTALPMYQRARLGLGYLPQEASIFRGLTVEQNIEAVAELAWPDKHKRREVVEDLLQEFSITHVRASMATALSGGERRRLEIARALATSPDFMLLDEPFAGIDPLAIADIKELVSQLKDRGLGVLITDHNVRDTLDIIDRASVIHQGEVLFEGSAEGVVTNEDVRRVYLGETYGP
ncbi:MAG: LPS export ABC transporter ATP-binding protein [Pseudomonadota bacterium]